jgi:tetratricopeptide (TPR) repeat protein
MEFGLRGSSRRILSQISASGLTLLLAACAMPDTPVPAAAPIIVPPTAAAPAFGESSSGAYLAGRDAQSRHDLTLASLYLLRALNTDPENVELLQRTTIALALEGRLEEAEAVAARLGSFDEESTVPALLLAERRAKHGDWHGVEEAVEHLPPRGLNNYLSPLVRAWAKAGQGDTDGALEALAQLDPKAGLGVLRDFNVGLVNDLAGRNEAAETAYRATLAAPSGHSLRTIEVIGDFLSRNGRADEAKQLAESLHQEHPDLPQVTFGVRRTVAGPADGLAEAFFGAAGTMRQGNAPELALLFSQFALDLQPDFDLARLMAGDVLSSLNQFRASNEAYRHLEPASPLYAMVQLRMAHNDEDLGDVDGAARQLESLISRKIDPADALLALGDLYRREHRWTDAVKAYDRALPLLQGTPGEWPVFYARGVALERANQWPRAEADLLHALELQPNEPQVLNYLGYSWVEQGTNLPRATQMIERAVLMRPSDGFIIDSLGWAFYRSGQYGRAVEMLQRAVTLVPGDATINDHLGDALWRAGREEEARFQWQHALLSDPDPELRAQLDAKLKQQGKDTP